MVQLLHDPENYLYGTGLTVRSISAQFSSLHKYHGNHRVYVECISASNIFVQFHADYPAVSRSEDSRLLKLDTNL